MLLGYTIKKTKKRHFAYSKDEKKDRLLQRSWFFK